MPTATDVDQLYVLSIGPSCGLRPIIMAMDHIDLVIIFLQHAPHTLFCYSQLICFVMAQVTDAEQLYVLGSGPGCGCGPSLGLML